MDANTTRDTSLAKCPKCQCQNWQDIPNATDQVRSSFSCSRCGYTVKLGACAGCKAKSWVLVSGIEPGGPRRPVYRLKCGSCGRNVGFVIDRL